jgi:hypothetical protein
MNQTESRDTLCNSCQNTNDLGRLRAEVDRLRALCRKVSGWRDADGVGLPLDLCRELCAAAKGEAES